MSYVVVCGLYLQRFLTDISLRYHPALDTIFKMGAVAANLARFALSHEYLRARPLNEVLDAIGTTASSGRDVIVSKLKTGRDSKLLAELGISVRLHAGRNCIFYETDKRNVKVVKTNGLGARAGVRASNRSAAHTS